MQRLALAVLFMTACMAPGKGDLVGDDATGDDDAPGAMGEDPLLEGSWSVASCANKFRSDALVDGPSILWTTTFYVDTACQRKYETYVVASDYSARGAANTPSNATKIDVLTKSVQRTVLTVEMADHFNQTGWCGHYDWEVNQPKDVSGDTCGGAVTPRAGLVEFQIYDVVNERWYFGDPGTGSMSSDATRPRALSTGYFSRRL